VDGRRGESDGCLAIRVLSVPSRKFQLTQKPIENLREFG
jgi:hypothetical protein